MINTIYIISKFIEIAICLQNTFKIIIKYI